MAPLRSPLRRVFPSHKSLARPPRKWLGLRLEQLEDRHLMAQNAIAVPFVDGLYQVLLDRVPGPGEAAGWIDGLQNGTSTPGRVALGFLHSPEFNLRVVQDQYTELLGRAA